MIIVDTNLLVYTVNASSPDHAAAKAWLERVVSGSEVIGLREMVLMGLIRIITQPRIVQSVVSARSAVQLVRRWLAQPNVQLLLSTPRSFESS